MELDYITDSDGYVTRVGDVVMFTENFAKSENSDKFYMVRAFPNYGDMVEMSECEMDEAGNAVNPVESVISVEPYKVMAI